MNINATLIGQAISFAIFVWFCLKYVWPPITNAMQERQKQLSEGLDNAEKAEQELAEAKAKAGEELVVAKQKAAELIEQANKRASQIIDEAKNQAVEAGERLKEAAQADIEQEINNAKEQLRGQVSVLAVLGAEKILQASVDQSAHSDMLNKLAAEL